MLASLSLLACASPELPAGLASPLPATPSDAPGALLFRAQVVEQGPMTQGAVAGATVTLYDSADVGSPMGAALTNVLGWAEIPARVTEQPWVLHARAEGHRDLWFWADQPASEEYRQFGPLGISSEADWQLQVVQAAGFAPEAAVVVVEAPGEGPGKLEASPPARGVRYFAGGLADPGLEESPIGLGMLAVEPGAVRVSGSRGGQRSSREVLAFPGAITAGWLLPEESGEPGLQAGEEQLVSP